MRNLSTLLVLVVLIQSYHAEDSLAEKPRTNDVDHYLNTTYGVVASNNYDNYLKALGVSIVKRLQLDLRDRLTVTQKDGVYTLTSRLLFRETVTEEFRLWVPFYYRNVEDRWVKAVVLKIGPVLIELQNEVSEGRQSAILRLFSAGGLLEVLLYKGVVAERIYAVVS